MPATKTTYMYLLPGSFTMDLRVQRPADGPRAARMADAFDPDALGQLTAWLRDGQYILIDGQHRDLAAQLAKWDGTLHVKVLEGITMAEAAKLFRLLNDTRQQRPLNRFLVSLTEGDEDALMVDRILRVENGLTFTPPTGFYAVSTALKIVRRRDGAEHLRWAVSTALAAYGKEPGSVNGQFIEALSLVHARYGGQIDTSAMKKRLAGASGGVEGILGDARTYQSIRGGHMVQSIADAVVVIYNKHRQAGKGALPEWTR